MWEGVTNYVVETGLGFRGGVKGLELIRSDLWKRDHQLGKGLGPLRNTVCVRVRGWFCFCRFKLTKEPLSTHVRP